MQSAKIIEQKQSVSLHRVKLSLSLCAVPSSRNQVSLFKRDRNMRSKQRDDIQRDLC